MSAIRFDKFAPPAWTQVPTQCVLCRHLAPGRYLICAAFPGAIPPAIIANEIDHRRPYLEDGQPADQGVPLKGSILFSPREGIDPRALDTLYRALDATRTSTSTSTS